MKKFLIILLAVSLFGELVTGQTILAPQDLRVNQSGQAFHGNPLDKNYKLSETNVNQLYNVFTDCEDGEYYLGFQLVYALGDRNTQNLWTETVEVELLKAGVSQWTASLSVNMAEQLFVTSVFHEQTVDCQELYAFRIIDKTGDSNPPDDFIVLKQRLYPKKDEIFNPVESFTVSHSVGSFNNEYNISWFNDLEGVQEYEVQWVYLDEYDDFSGTNAASAFAFKEGAGVILGADQLNYKLHSYYPNGQLYFRVRAIGLNPDHPEYPVLGQWQYDVNSAATMTNHASDKNWQVVNTYAEEGKVKQVIDYMDGSYRSRQTITNLNTDNNIAIAESYYDFEGRPVVNVIPAPVKSNDLYYRPDFNEFNRPAGWSYADKFMYDNGLRTNSLLDDKKGSSKYFSGRNDLNSRFEKMIPDAKGYAYSQMEYVNDNTGRAAKQSGLGATFNIDNGKVTRHFYSDAAEEELVSLFGSNVGESNHYRKNAILDPNGQLSISYVDQANRTIATALAGGAPENLEELSSLKDGVWEDMTFDISDKNFTEGRTITHSHTILNQEVNTVYNFEYDLAATADQSSDFGCINCSYDLEISITDANGNLLTFPADPKNQSTDDHYFRIYDFNAINCDKELTEAIQFSMTFGLVGKYTINKQLTAREVDMESLETLVLQDASVVSEIEIIKESYEVDMEDCEFCNDCDVDEEIENAITEVIAQDCENILNQIVDDLQSKDNSGEAYEPSQQEIMDHSLYCEYEFCVKNKKSAEFEVQMSRIKDWNDAESKGFDDLVNMDPFFNDSELSGYTEKSKMEALLADILVATVPFDSDFDLEPDGSEEYRGGILEALDYDNTAFYVDEYGNESIQGNHILYLDLQAKRDQFSNESYFKKLDVQKWRLFSSYYLNFKRQIKRQLAEIQGCASLQEKLQAPDQLPTAEDDVKNFGDELGITGEVSDEQVNSFLTALTTECGADFSEAERLTITSGLKTYFDEDLTNTLEFINVNDLDREPLKSIEAILANYQCGLTGFAVEDPLICVRDTTFTIAINDLSGTANQLTANPIPVEGVTANADNPTVAANNFDPNLTLLAAPDCSGLYLNSQPAGVDVPYQQINALIQLYCLTDGDNWTDIPEGRKWKKNDEFDLENIGNWSGLRFVSNQVDYIGLNNKNLSGNLSQWDLVNQLTALQSIYLPNNDLKGDLSSCNIS